MGIYILFGFLWAYESCNNIGWTAMSPMAGVSDSPGRIMSRRYGAHFSFTEFGGADYLAAGNQDTLKLYEFTPEERPIIFQIFGSDPDRAHDKKLAGVAINPSVTAMKASLRRLRRRNLLLSWSKR